MSIFSALFKKKSEAPKEREPLKLPRIPESKMNIADISEMLNNGTPIWTWTSLLDKFNTTAMLNMQGNALDGFACFRKEHDLLMKYVAIVSPDNTVHLKLTEICKCTNSNIMELINTEFKDAYKVYYDDLGFTESTQYFIHDLKYEDIVEYLTDNRVMYVGEEHFYKKADYPDGLPED